MWDLMEGKLILDSVSKTKKYITEAGVEKKRCQKRGDRNKMHLGEEEKKQTDYHLQIFNKKIPIRPTGQQNIPTHHGGGKI